MKATGAATEHYIGAASGDVDFLFSSPTINWLLVNHKGPYKKFDNGPELEAKVGMIFNYELGPYHYVTRADSGIKTLTDLKGRKVFAGPPGGAAKSAVLKNITTITGLNPEDMDVQDFGWDASIQAFQDDKIEVLVIPTNIPSPAIQQFALTKKIRLLDLPVEKLVGKVIEGSTVDQVIPVGAYGNNHVNDQAARTHGAFVNFSAGMHVDEEAVYQVTKAIWEHLDEIHQTAQWMPSTVNQTEAFKNIAGRLHPGAERYYREAGWTIPDATVYKPE